MAECWLTVTEAAARAGANKSSISRFLAKNADVPVKRNAAGAVVQVEYEALRAARAGSLSVLDSAETRGAAVQAHPAPAAVPATAPQSSRRREIQDELAEIELGQRKGELISRKAVLGAVEAAGVALTQALERRRRALAGKLAGVNDVRAVELELKASDRLLLAALTAELQRAARGEDAPDGVAGGDLVEETVEAA
jgi:hypothetical protein